MEWVWAVLIGLVGLVVGTFSTTVVARVPENASLRTPGPSCATCHRPIRASDQVPVVSWLLLHGRCRSCGAAIPAAFPIIEAATGILFAATAVTVGSAWELPVYLYLAAFAVAASAIDLAHHRLPNAIVLPSYPITLGLLVLALGGPGTPADLLRAVLAGAALYAAFLLLLLINPAGMGGGDVKLAGVLGMLLGWNGWWPVVVGGLASFFIGAIVSLLLMIFGRAGRKTKIPFGPFMFLGAYVGLLYGDSFGNWYVG